MGQWSLRKIFQALITVAQPGFLLAGLALAACSPCPPEQCDLAMTLGPVDGAMVPGALEATAQQFLGTSGTTAGGGTAGGMGSSTGGGGVPSLPLTRDTLSPDSDTPYQITSNQSIGLRLERHWPVTQQTRAFMALRGAAGQQIYRLSEGLGPLTDPMRIDFVTGLVGTEVGLRHERALTAHPDTALRLSVSAGYDLTQTRTHLQSALVDVTNQHKAIQRHATLGAGLVWRPAGTMAEIEWRTEARVLEGGQRLLRSEWRFAPR